MQYGILTLFFLFASTSYAQFQYESGSEIQMEITEPYQTGEISCQPDPIRNIILNWELLEISTSVPSTWDFTICDQICYPYFATNGNPISYSAADFNQGIHYKLKLGVNVNDTEGSGYVSYRIFDSQNESVSDTVVFHINYSINGLINSSPSFIKLQQKGNTILFISSNEQKHNIRLYRNDSSIYLASSFQSYLELENLPEGIYFLITDDLQTQKIVIVN